MVLGELIELLEQYDPSISIPRGFGEPMSYRGYYEQLAFEHCENTTIGEMLEHAKSALNTTFEGYKGGQYTMNEYSECWVANYGSVSGTMITPFLIDLMVNKGFYLH